MISFGPRLRLWLTAWLALALPMAGYARTLGFSCRMACAHEAKACHSCCGEKPGCGIADAKAIPAVPAKAVAASASTPDVAVPCSVLLRVFLPLLPAAFDQVRDLGPPRVIDFQVAHCIRLL
jgi:hypothetical protein